MTSKIFQVRKDVEENIWFAVTTFSPGSGSERSLLGVLSRIVMVVDDFNSCP